jgi:hypothetical protein
VKKLQEVALIAVVFAALSIDCRPSNAFWLLNFSTAQTVEPGHVGFIGGTGGQFTLLTKPTRRSFTPFLAHAGLRLGLVNGLDIGYRLVSVPMPWNAVGPTLGGSMDAKVRLTPAAAVWKAALIGGGAVSYLDLFDRNHLSWSVGGALTVTREVNAALSFTANARYAYNAFPSTQHGTAGNNVHVFGGSLASRIALTSQVAVVPEIGVFRVKGFLHTYQTGGIGMQYGVVLASSL